MANSDVADPLAPPLNATLTSTLSTGFWEDPLPIPPMDPVYLSQSNDISMDDLDLDFSFDDLDLDLDTDLPFDIDSSLNHDFQHGLVDHGDPTQVHQADLACYVQPDLGSDLVGNNKNSSSGTCQFPGDQIDGDAILLNSSPQGLCSSGSRVLDFDLSELHPNSCDLSGILNASSESNGSNKDTQESANGNQGHMDPRVPDSHSPESRGSGECSSNVSSALNSLSNGLNQSLNSSPGSGVDSNKPGQTNNIHSYSNSVLKRKKEDGESNSVKLRMSKCRKPIDIRNTETNTTNTTNLISEEEEKKKTRLLRNRESAQLSRQRKKNYVEELEGKVRTMHSTIKELNVKISCVMAENASLRQQIGGSGVVPTNPPPPPGMYSAPPMYPWMPCTPPYFVKPHGSNVPLVPIPKLKPQQPISSTKKKERKIKTAASVSFIGLLFFMLMFGGLVPMITVRHGGMREAFMGGNYAGNGLYDNHHVRVLAANGTRNHLNFANAKHFGDGFNNVGETHVDVSKIVYSANSSESLEASLYVPRNDKLVKIDGSLIIHSILASEKALKSSQETGLAIPGDFAPARRNPYTYKGPVEGEGALVPGVVDRDYKWFTSADGRLQQWFQEGLSGSTFSSGMCTEVFQFHASSAIVPVTSSTRNVSIEPAQSTSYKGQQNRRVLRSPLPISASSQNMTEENVGISEPKENISSNRTVPPMVVSVLVDPRDAADGGENMMGKKTLSRIFVVVLIDSVKYVTYSCILPVKGSVRL